MDRDWTGEQRRTGGNMEEPNLVTGGEGKSGPKVCAWLSVELIKWPHTEERNSGRRTSGWVGVGRSADGVHVNHAEYAVFPLISSVAQGTHHNYIHRLQEHSNTESSRSIKPLWEPSLSGPGAVPAIICCLPWCAAHNESCSNAEVPQRRCHECKELRADLWRLSIKERNPTKASEGNQWWILRIRGREEGPMLPQKLREQRNSQKDEELSLSNIEKEKKQSWEMVHSMANTEVPGDPSPSTKSLRQMAYFPILKI